MEEGARHNCTCMFVTPGDQQNENRYKRHAKEALTLAREKRAIDPADVNSCICRLLQPSDLGLATPTFSFPIPSSGTVQLLNYIVPSNKFIYIFGVYDVSPTPAIQSLQIAGSSLRESVNIPLQHLWAHRLSVGYFNVGLGFGPGDVITVKAVASNSSATEPLGLIGFVVERDGPDVVSTMP